MGGEQTLHQRRRVHGDIVIEDRAILGRDRFDMDDLESLVFQFSDGAREDIVGFALQFGSSAGRALFCRKRGGIQAIGMRLPGRVLRFKLHFGSKHGAQLGLIVEPACRSDQYEQND